MKVKETALLVGFLTFSILLIVVGGCTSEDNIYNISGQLTTKNKEINTEEVTLNILGNKTNKTVSPDQVGNWSATVKGEVTINPVHSDYTSLPLEKRGISSEAEGLNFTLESSPTIDPIQGVNDEFIRGMDVSALEAIEEHGGKYYDNGTARDMLKILKDHGVNYIRLRLWNDPAEGDAGTPNLETVKSLAHRAKDLNMKVLLDIHYSDFWADPGNQEKPDAWKDYNFSELKQAVNDFTYNSLMELEQVGALPDMIQIGNEVNSGMLWPDGLLWGNESYTDEEAGGWSQFGELLQAGLNATNQVETETGATIKTIIHKADPGEGVGWFMEDLEAQGVTGFDIVGISYYPYWHGHGALRQNYDNGPYTNLLAEMNAVADMGYEVAVVETSYGFTLQGTDNGGYHLTQDQLDGIEDNRYLPQPSIQSQAEMTRRVMEAVNDVNGGKGLGVFYWGGELIRTDGVGWKAGAEGFGYDNQALFDREGNALPSLDIFNKVVAE